jgi:hypothetical protein
MGWSQKSFRWVAISFIPEFLRRKPVNLYPQISCPSVVRLKAGFSYEALAYQITTGDAFDDVKGLNVGFTFEAAFPLKDFKAIVAELGFTTQPSGGNADADVTWAPIFYLTVGYEFGG